MRLSSAPRDEGWSELELVVPYTDEEVAAMRGAPEPDRRVAPDASVASASSTPKREGEPVNIQIPIPVGGTSMKTSPKPSPQAEPTPISRPRRDDLDVGYPLGAGTAPVRRAPEDPITTAVRHLGHAARHLRRRLGVLGTSQFEEETVRDVLTQLVDLAKRLYDPADIEAVERDVLDRLRVERDVRLLEDLTWLAAPVRPQPDHHAKPGKRHRDSWAERMERSRALRTSPKPEA